MISDKKILEHVKKNSWLNGSVDYQDGDLMAIHNAKGMFKHVHEYENLGTLHRELYNGVTGIFRYKNLIFANHWSYGCFVYRILDNEIIEFEHLTISAYTPDRIHEFIDFVQRTLKATKEQLKKLDY